MDIRNNPKEELVMFACVLSVAKRLGVIAFLMLNQSIFPSACAAGERTVFLNNGGKLLQLPHFGTALEQVGCVALLPPTPDSPEGTLVCSIGANNDPPFRESPPRREVKPLDCILFISLPSGELRRSTAIQPAPDFAVKSANGRYLAFASSMGVAFNERARRGLLKDNGETKLSSSSLAADTARKALADSFVGSILYSVWDSHSESPIWEMRYAPEGEEADAMRFMRPWDLGGKTAIPWWAIDARPLRHRYPKMSFSPCGKYFVACCDHYGIHILDLASGSQRYITNARLQGAPQTFWFHPQNRIICLLDTGMLAQIDLGSGECVGLGGAGKLGDKMPVVYENDSCYPLFVCDGTGHHVATITANKLSMFHVQLDSHSEIELFNHRPKRPLGIERMELSIDGAFVGVEIANPLHPSGEHLRYVDYGITDRYERISVLDGRVVERVMIEPGFWERQDGDLPFEDGVSTTLLPSTVRGAFGACLSADGKNIVSVYFDRGE